jgi:CO/xanthine dehydrogenase Mo-binding subunit
MVRSPHAHARIRAIHKEKALQHPGVIAVFTGKDMVDSGVKSLPCGWLLPGIKLPPHYPMAVDKVRHVGEIVAVVIAQDRYTAEDAARLVEVEYEVAAGRGRRRQGPPARQPPPSTTRPPTTFASAGPSATKRRPRRPSAGPIRL